MLRGLILDYGGVLTDRDSSSDEAEPPLVRAARLARGARFRTAVLSNADIGSDVWGGAFDTVVMAGAVSTAKPDPEIYLLTAERLGLPAADCVFVDDHRPNVAAAVAVGMVGVHHSAVTSTLDELEILLAPVSLR